MPPRLALGSDPPARDRLYIGPDGDWTPIFLVTFEQLHEARRAGKAVDVAAVEQEACFALVLLDSLVWEARRR